MNFFKKTLLPLFLLSSIVGYTHAAWSDYIPFKWFMEKSQEKLTQQLLEAIINDYDQEEIIELIEKGADVNYQDQYGIAQVLYLTIAKGNSELLEILIEKGADINLKDNIIGLTPIFAAIQNIEMLKLVLKYGANPNVQIITGQTPLIIASAENQVEMVKVLLEYNADKNVADTEGKTALDYAKESELQEIIQLLEETPKEA